MAHIIMKNNLKIKVVMPSERDQFFPDLKTLSWKKLERRYAKDRIDIVVRRRIAASPIGKLKRAIIR